MYVRLKQNFKSLYHHQARSVWPQNLSKIFFLLYRTQPWTQPNNEKILLSLSKLSAISFICICGSRGCSYSSYFCEIEINWTKSKFPSCRILNNCEWIQLYSRKLYCGSLSFYLRLRTWTNAMLIVKVFSDEMRQQWNWFVNFFQTPRFRRLAFLFGLDLIGWKFKQPWRKFCRYAFRSIYRFVRPSTYFCRSRFLPVIDSMRVLVVPGAVMWVSLLRVRSRYKWVEALRNYRHDSSTPFPILWERAAGIDLFQIWSGS